MTRFLKKNRTLKLLLVLTALGLLFPGNGICSEFFRYLQVDCMMEEFSSRVCQENQTEAVCVASSLCCKGLEMGRNGLDKVLVDSSPLLGVLNPFGWAPDYQKKDRKLAAIDSEWRRGSHFKILEAHFRQHQFISLTLTKSSLLC